MASKNINPKKVDGSALPTSNSGLGSDDLWQDNGSVRVGTSTPTGGSSIYTADGTSTGNRIFDLGGNSLTFETNQVAGKLPPFFKVNELGDVELLANDPNYALKIYDSTTSGQINFSVLRNGVNKIASSSSGLDIGYFDGTGLKGTEHSTTSFNIYARGSKEHDFYTGNSANNYVWLFRNGLSGNQRLYIGGLDINTTAHTHIHSGLAIKGNGTSTGSALAIYNNDTTPIKLWDFLDNGNVGINQSSSFLLSANKTLKVDGSSNTSQNIFELNGATNAFGTGAITVGAYGNVEVKGTNSAGNFKVLTMLGNEYFTLDGNGNNSTLRTKAFDFGTSTTTGYKMSFDAGRHQFIRLGVVGAYFDLVNSSVQFWEAGMTSRKFIVGGSSLVGTEQISLQGDTLLNANVNMSNLPTSTTGLSSGDLWNNNGEVRIGTSTPTPVSSIYTADGTLTGNRTIDLDTKTLTIDGTSSTSLPFTVNSKEVYSGIGTFFRVNLNGGISVRGSSGGDGNISAYSGHPSSQPRIFHVGRFGGGEWYGGAVTIGTSSTSSKLQKTDTNVDFYDVNNILRHKIGLSTGSNNQHTRFFYSGYTNNGRFIIGSSATISTENISLQGSTLIKGNGTSTGSALAIYNNDTTPVKLWSFLDNGNVNLGVDSTVDLDGNSLTFEGGNTTLKAENTTSNSYTNFIFQALNTNGTRNFFLGNGGEVEIGKGISNTTTGDKSVDCLWGAEGLVRGGSGQYAVVVGSGNNATFTGTGVVAIGKSVTTSIGRTAGVGENINLGHENSYGFGRVLTSGANESLMFGTTINGNGRYGAAIGHYLETSATGASLIGNGNTSTGVKLVNNTSNSLGLGWNTTTPQHLFKSDGVNLTLPTSSTGLSSGDLWDDNGSVRIGTSASNGGSGTKVLVKGSMGANQIVGNTTPIVEFVTTGTPAGGSLDVNSEWDNTNHKFTVGSSGAGTYLVQSNIFLNNGSSWSHLFLYKNGSVYAPFAGFGTAAGWDNCDGTIAIDLVVGDYIDIRAYSSSNGTIDFNNHALRQSFSITKVSAVAPAAGTDVNALHTNISNEINSVTEKTNPSNTDKVLIEESDGTKKSQSRKNFKRPIVSTTTSTSSLTPSIDDEEAYVLTALSDNLTINAPTGTPYDFQTLWFRITDNGVSRTITKNAIFVDYTGNFPTSTTINKQLIFASQWDGTNWNILAWKTQP